MGTDAESARFRAWDQVEARANELMCGVGRGCRSSFMRLYELTSPWLYGIISRINRTPADAEETLQDVYVKVWFHASQFDLESGRALQWLAGIARHGAIDRLRRSKVRPDTRARDVEVDVDPYEGLASPDPGPLEICIARRSAHAVRRSLRALPKEQRLSLMLAYFDGLSHAEIAERLGHPLGTIKSWVRRSLMSMRTAMDGLN